MKQGIWYQVAQLPIKFHAKFDFFTNLNLLIIRMKSYTYMYVGLDIIVYPEQMWFCFQMYIIDIFTTKWYALQWIL